MSKLHQLLRAQLKVDQLQILVPDSCVVAHAMQVNFPQALSSDAELRVAHVVEHLWVHELALGDLALEDHGGLITAHANFDGLRIRLAFDRHGRKDVDAAIQRALVAPIDRLMFDTEVRRVELEEAMEHVEQRLKRRVMSALYRTDNAIGLQPIPNAIAEFQRWAQGGTWRHVIVGPEAVATGKMSATPVHSVPFLGTQPVQIWDPCDTAGGSFVILWPANVREAHGEVALSIVARWIQVQATREDPGARCGIAWRGAIPLLWLTARAECADAGEWLASLVRNNIDNPPSPEEFELVRHQLTGELDVAAGSPEDLAAAALEAWNSSGHPDHLWHYGIALQQPFSSDAFRSGSMLSDPIAIATCGDARWDWAVRRGCLALGVRGRYRRATGCARPAAPIKLSISNLTSPIAGAPAFSLAFVDLHQQTQEKIPALIATLGVLATRGDWYGTIWRAIRHPDHWTVSGCAESDDVVVAAACAALQVASSLELFGDRSDPRPALALITSMPRSVTKLLAIPVETCGLELPRAARSRTTLPEPVLPPGLTRVVVARSGPGIGDAAETAAMLLSDMFRHRGGLLYSLFPRKPDDDTPDRIVLATGAEFTCGLQRGQIWFEAIVPSLWASAARERIDGAIASICRGNLTIQAYERARRLAENARSVDGQQRRLLAERSSRELLAGIERREDQERSGDRWPSYTDFPTLLKPFLLNHDLSSARVRG